MSISPLNLTSSNRLNTPRVSSFLDEFRASAIPDCLTSANIVSISGDHAVQILVEDAITKAQKNTSYVTMAAKRILDRYEFAAAGGWVAYGCNPNGIGSGSVAYFKPINPRTDFERHRKIKYETPPGCEALPIQPWVDTVTAQAIYQRYCVLALEDETFWQVVQRHNLPIVITEGLKKALSLIAHGGTSDLVTWHHLLAPERHFRALSCTLLLRYRATEDLYRL